MCSALQAVGKTLVCCSESLDVGGIVVGDHDRIVADPHIAFQARREATWPSDRRPSLSKVRPRRRRNWWSTAWAIKAIVIWP